MKVEFDSDGVELIGRLFLPTHGGPAPGVVAGTWTSVKELMVDRYARRLLGICAAAMYMSDNAADDPAVKSLALVAPWLHDATICAQVYGGSEAVAATTRTPPSPTARGASTPGWPGPRTSSGPRVPSSISTTRNRRSPLPSTPSPPISSELCEPTDKKTIGS